MLQYFMPTFCIKFNNRNQCVILFWKRNQDNGICLNRYGSQKSQSKLKKKNLFV